jgi:tRNA (adenine57-N1/adenine58-N1)-methyltransferase
VELVRGLEMQQAFGQIEVEEILVRPYKAVPDRFRPADRMIAHTGYLIFARKVSRDVSKASYWMDRRRRKHEGLQDEPEE